MSKLHPVAIQLAIVAALVAVWEAASVTGAVDPRLLPSPGIVFRRMIELLANPAILQDLGITLAAIALAFVIVAPIGIGIGLLLAESAYFSKAFSGVFHFLAGVPKSVFLPLFILLFGISFSQKVAFGVFQAIFVLVISTTAAVSSVQPELVRLAKVNGASRSVIYREIYWPSMLPLIIEGMRLGMIFNIAGVLFAEMYASRSGFGAEIANWGRNFDMPSLYAGVLIITILSIVVNESLRLYERKVGKWRTS